MAEESDNAPAPWSISALKEYFERIFKDLKAEIDRRFTDSQREVDKALAAAKEAVKAAFESSENVSELGSILYA